MPSEPETGVYARIASLKNSWRRWLEEPAAVERLNEWYAASVGDLAVAKVIHAKAKESRTLRECPSAALTLADMASGDNAPVAEGDQSPAHARRSRRRRELHNSIRPHAGLQSLRRRPLEDERHPPRLIEIVLALEGDCRGDGGGSGASRAAPPGVSNGVLGVVRGGSTVGVVQAGVRVFLLLGDHGGGQVVAPMVAWAFCAVSATWTEDGKCKEWEAVMSLINRRLKAASGI